ncbi:MAG: MerR family transcriptional regulator [Candidatus Riflebacteria bacterium]|nr:MerR family transcriptional regulator [Candidatus Riflebacteria bacterium]
MTARDMMKIGGLAKLTGKTARTIRYYEELELLSPVGHTAGGFRLYGPGMVQRIELIDRFRAAGMPLEEIARIVRCYTTSRTGHEAMGKLLPLLRAALGEVETRMAVLRRFRDEIESTRASAERCLGCTRKPAEESCAECHSGSRKGASGFIGELVK